MFVVALIFKGQVSALMLPKLKQLIQMPVSCSCSWIHKRGHRRKSEDSQEYQNFISWPDFLSGTFYLPEVITGSLDILTFLLGCLKVRVPQLKYLVFLKCICTSSQPVVRAEKQICIDKGSRVWLSCEAQVLGFFLLCSLSLSLFSLLLLNSYFQCWISVVGSPYL